MIRSGIGAAWRRRGVVSASHEEEAAAFREIVSIRERILGAANVETLATRKDLAEALIALGKYEEAEVEFEHCSRSRWRRSGTTTTIRRKRARMWRGALYSQKKYAEAFPLFCEAGDAGNGFAAHMAGCMYNEGTGTEKDQAQALSWYRRSAELGFPLAECALGSALISSNGGPKKEEEGLKWLEKSSADGCGKADRALGVLLCAGSQTAGGPG